MGFVPVRKDGALFPGPLIEQQTQQDYRGNRRTLATRRDLLSDGQRVVLVDDWIETGSQAIVSQQLVAQCGAELVAVAVIVDEANPRRSCGAPTGQIPRPGIGAVASDSRSVSDPGSCKDGRVRTSPWPAQSGALFLRDPQPEDADQLVALRNNPVVNRFMLRTHVDPDAYVQEWASIPDSATDFSCIAELDGRLAGLGFLDVTNGQGQPGMPQGTQGVIGYMLQPDLAGRGLGTDLARGRLTAAFDALRLRRVTASCNADNIASARILEKNGMRREQHGIEDSWHTDLGWVDGYRYAMLDREWAAAQPVQ